MCNFTKEYLKPYNIMGDNEGTCTIMLDHTGSCKIKQFNVRQSQILMNVNRFKFFMKDNLICNGNLV